MLVYQRVVRTDVEPAKISEMCRSPKIAALLLSGGQHDAKGRKCHIP